MRVIHEDETFEEKKTFARRHLFETGPKMAEAQMSMRFLVSVQVLLYFCDGNLGKNVILENA